MIRRKLLMTLMAMLAVAAGTTAAAQGYARMVNGTTLNIAACDGTIAGVVDDGGQTGQYSNSFNGTVVLTWQAGDQLTLQGNYNLEGCCDYITVWDGTPSSGIQLWRNCGSGTLNLTATSGCMTINFTTDGSVVYDGFVLTWSVDGSSSCANSITSLTASAVGTSTATLTWNATNPAGPFTVVCDGDTATTNTTTINLTGLNPASIHNATVSAAGETSMCCRAQTIFRTLCDTVHMPWTEGFELMPLDSVPTCWTVLTNFDDADAQPRVVANYANEGVQSLMLSCGNNATGGHFGMAVGPRMSLDGASGQLKITMRSSHYNTYVTIGTCSLDSSYTSRYDFIPLSTVTVNSAWSEFYVPLAGAIADGRSLAFYMVQSAQEGTGRRVYIDLPQVAACGVSNLQISEVESRTMNVSWDTYGSAVVTLHLRRSGNDADEQTIVAATSPLTLTGLEPLTYYNVLLTTQCGTSASAGAMTADSAVAVGTWCLGGRGASDMLAGLTLVNSTASISGDNIHLGRNAGVDAYVMSPEFSAMGGKQVAVILDGYYAHVSVGVATSRSDTSTFVPLASGYTDYFHIQYLSFTIPDSLGNGFLTLRYNGSYIYLRRLEVSDCAIDSLRVVHQRRHEVVLGLTSNGPNDTIMVEYGYSGFEQGTGTVRTFVGQRRIVIDSLSMGNSYDFIVYRPCGAPCSNARLRANTPYVNYPEPLCEDFSYIEWGSSWYGWAQYDTYNSSPTVVEMPYYFGAGMSLRLTSFGTGNSYFSSVLVPDVSLDSTTYLSFYATNMAPDGELVIGTHYSPQMGYGDVTLRIFDTLQLAGYGTRQHFVMQLPAYDSVVDGHLYIAYHHNNPYQNFDVYIDELHVSHAAYSNASMANVDSNNAAVVVTPFAATDTVFEVTLRDEADAFVGIDTIGASDTAFFHGLAPCTTYKVYVRPLANGDTVVCPSYAMYFITNCGGGTSADHCFPFDAQLSYELPYEWTATDATSHSVDTGYLHLYGAGAELCLPPYGNIEGHTLSLLGEGHGTLVLGYADTTFSVFHPIDTIVFTDGDTVRYATPLPPMPSDTLRVALRVATAGDTVQLDHIGVSLCGHIDIQIEGNTAVCTTADSDPLYYLFVTDTTGAERMYMVNTPTHVVTDLMPGWKYDFSWQCAYDDATCRPHKVLRTDEHLRLPYCIDFSNGTPSSAADAWELVSPSTSAYRNDYSSYVTYYCQYTTSYLILPPLDSNATVVTLDGSLYHNAAYSPIEVGVLASGNDTSTFVSLWTDPSSSYYGYSYPTVDFSGHAGRHIAIKYTGSSFEVNRIFIHPYSPMTVRRTAAGRFELVNSHDDYYVHVRNYCGIDTIMHIDTTCFLLDVGTNCSEVYLQQVDDSLGHVCRTESVDYYTSNLNAIPWCWNSDSYYNIFTNYNTSGYEYLTDCYFTRLYGARTTPSSQVIVMPEIDIDPVSKLNVKFTFLSQDSNAQSLEIGVMTDALDTTTFVPVDTIVYHSADTAHIDFQVSLANYSGNGRWVAFRYRPDSYDSYNYSFIGRFCFDTCSATGATAKLLRWNTVQIDNPSGEGGFYAAYYREGYWNDTIIRIDTVPTTLILQPESKYYFNFRCDSSAGATCRPTHEINTLGTPMEVPSCTDFESVPLGQLPPSWTRYNNGIAVDNTQANSGDQCLTIPISPQSYVVTGDIEADTLNHIAVSLWLMTSENGSRLEVGAMNNPADLASFHSIRTISNRQNGVWQRHTVILESAPDDAHYLALRARNTVSPLSGNIYVDDVYLTPCATDDMRLTNVNPTDFTVVWQQAGTPNITVTVLNGDSVEQTLHPTVPPLLVTGLDPHSVYTIRLSSDCGDTGTFCTAYFTDSATIVAPGDGGGCINPTDLYSSQATFFTGTFNNPYSAAGAVDYGMLSSESRHTVCYDTAARDPRTGGLLRMVPEGYTSSLRLGNWSTNSYAPEAEGVIYSLTVDTADFQLILLRYAAVLQDPLHAADDQPRLRIEVLDSTFTPIDPVCTSADFIADASLGWNSAPNSVLWKDWTTVGIDLSNYADQLVYIRLTTFDCNEGSHYGYAYFTLECMRKAMESTACGAIDSNTFTAPAGFNYRWYTDQSPATISTSQSITMATANVTYLCDLSKIDNASCMFTISAYGGTRYPMASFDTAMTMSDCRFYVNFTNTSSVSADGVTPLPGEGCESAWWDFGNGQTATTYHASTVYTLPGTYTVMLVSGIAGGACTDTAYFNITLTIPDGVIPMDSTYASICSNESYSFYGSNYNTAGLYSHATENIGTCDSMHLLFLTVRAVTTGDTMATVCDSFSWYGTTATVDTLMTRTGQNAVLCDSITTLHLTVLHSTASTIYDTIVENQLPYTFNGVTFTGNVAHSIVHIANAAGCDSTIDYNLTVHPNTTGTADSTVCANELPLLWHSRIFTAAGTQLDTLTAYTGADSVLSMTLTVLPVYDDTVTASICDNQNITFEGSTYNTAGNHSHLLHTVVGSCDSLRTLALTVNPTSGGDTLAAACDSFAWRGYTYTNTDFASQHYTQAIATGVINSYGCDSTVTLQLTLHSSHNATLTDTIVQNSMPYSVAGQSVAMTDLTTTSDATAQYANTYGISTVDGCDSTLAFNLTVWLNRTENLTLFTCRNELPFIINGDSIVSTSDTVYRTYNLATTHGADSTLLLTLVIAANIPASFSDTIVENQLPYTFRSHTFYGATDTVLVLPAASSCDTIASYSLYVWPNVTVHLEQTVCDDVLPLLWGGQTFTSADSVTFTLPDIHGADSTVTLVLHVNPTYEVSDTHVICPTQPYTYEGVDFGGPVSFDSPHLSVLGCDSLVHVVLMPRDTTFRLSPLYSHSGNNWMPLDSIVLGCAPDTIYLHDTTRGATAWQWTASVYDTVLTSNSDYFELYFDSVILAPTSTLSIAVTSVIDGVTCIDTLHYPVYVFRTPKAEFDWNPPLPALDKPEVQFNNLSSPFDSLTYLWYIPPTSGSTDYDTTSDPNPFYHWGQDGDNMEGDYDVSLVAYWTQVALGDTSVQHVCTDTATHTVTITNDYLQFPNLVTPNGDNNNDIWRVVNLLEYGLYPTNELWIFNQWGVEIYHVRDIREESDFWDPNATASPDGTYYFRFSARSDYGVVKRNGIIEVLRTK